MGNIRQLIHSSSTAGSWPATSSVDIVQPSYRRFEKENKPLITRKKGIRSKGSVLNAILAKHHGPVEETVHDQQTVFNTHAALQANVAMLDFAKKLPLEELRTIGYQPTAPTFVKRGNTAMSDEVDNDSTRERRGSSAGGDSGRTLSFSQQSVDSCDLFLQSIGLPTHETSFSIMSDEEFEALPDWADVEEEAEYNVLLERHYHWSNTNSAYSSRASIEADFVFPTISVPPGFSGCHDGYRRQGCVGSRNGWHRRCNGRMS
ncbi:hypothetical protein P3342_007226 [Pyrenophora teres f. teres]|uniref:Uncharacterized protein n=1 Tax=Pyrenophora teres f. teres (strain 0-1) TaxID=861557 RepID=E3RTY0_PYRTT|nr:hypothetical protein PTT_12501 [Pyrenophora teres f. teres 0-1]KAE8833890.1 hypothetical protein HRS9139_05709 [Pyrenophora teres f. teres]KAE8840338.1 hypothetical protein PTNB85_03737 [Pyrenophora teres f. teres]KAE8849522.1 hypothetical protein HRS9122_03538 [Pyrenophora teres f. teres]KAE8863837.1 hypothetical protein PTNB29_03801 [Pyrenophora teres f. teres]